MARITIETIAQDLQDTGWQIVSNDYTNLSTEMEFKCPENHLVRTSWKRLRANLECPICKQSEHYLTLENNVPKLRGGYRILALDQSSHISGWAVFDNQQLIKCGKFDAGMKDEIDRFEAIHHWFINMVTNWNPDFVALEGVQYQDESNGQKMGVTVFQTLARLQGILMITCREFKIPFEFCPTNTWRHECGVKGRSRTDRKKSMQMLVKQWYDISVTDDESDAIGIGYYMSKKRYQLKKPENWET